MYTWNNYDYGAFLTVQYFRKNMHMIVDEMWLLDGVLKLINSPHVRCQNETPVELVCRVL